MANQMLAGMNALFVYNIAYYMSSHASTHGSGYENNKLLGHIQHLI
jgi:hypothetical protein